MDEQQRGRVRDDLQGFFKGELLFDDVARALYSTDASIFQVLPAGVAVPRDEEDVRALVKYAYANDVPLVARGAGTGVAGESLGRGLVVDLSKHFRDVVEVGDDWVRVQPGVTLGSLQARLAKVGRRFAPDPASGNVCTLGGMLANNASGSHALRHGYTRDHVRAVRAVLDNGEALTLGRERVPRPTDSVETPTHLHDILATLAVLLEENADLVVSQRPRTRFNRCGYLLDGVLDGGVLDLPKLLVGSEGTLALFTEATLRTIPLAGGQSLVLLGFDRLDTALRAAQRSLAAGPAACELLDRRLLTLARGSDAGRAAALVPPTVEAVLLIEFEADTLAEAQRLAREVVELVSEDGPASHVLTAQSPQDHAELWQLREVALPSLYGLKGRASPVPLVEDVGVPVGALPDYLRGVQEALQELDITASFLVHAGAGQVHTRPFLDLRQPEHVAKLWALAERVHGLALELGGTVSTQHGTGLARSAWVARQYGPLYPVFRQVKAVFDPKNLFNPGKIVDPDVELTSSALRVPAQAAEPTARWHLRWDEAEVLAEAGHCNGCGACRARNGQHRMCPVFRATGNEAATPRAKANLLRQLLYADPSGKQLASDEVRAVADLCVNCKMCATECPAHVDVPRLMLEAKAANVAQHGLDRAAWFLARLETVVRWGSAFSLLANLALGSRSMRWLFDRLFGLSPRRRLPRFALRTFMAVAKRRGWTRKPTGTRPRVAYFADLYANFIDPQVAEAAVLVLQHNGFDVYVPPGQRGSGIEALSQGDVEAARETAMRNLRVLADLAREGLPVVCSEPSAVVMLRQDYLDLVDDADAALVAGRTVELTQFLWDLHLQGKLRTDFQPLDTGVGHHVPCHVKALGAAPAGPRLLGLIPGLRVQVIDVSCSGMAGTFGLSTENHATSLAAGAPMLEELRRPRALFGSSECSSCRLQMEDAGEKRSLHPVQYLALAYGLLPELSQRLREPFHDLVVR